MLNRQTRLHTSDNSGRWASRGPISISDAAKAEAALYEADDVKIDVRDAETPDTVWTVTVKRRTAYEVEGLRQPGSDA